MTVQKDIDIDELVDGILKSPKYRSLDICEDTVRDLMIQELGNYLKKGQAIDSVRKKLHNVIAGYLGNPDYNESSKLLNAAFNSQNRDSIRNTCAQIMQAHVSTRERLPYLESIYSNIYNLTGKPDSILDLACGLHPLSFPWMELPTSVQYYAYDILKSRINFINQYFLLEGLPLLAQLCDVLVSPPPIKADVAFLFKEIHRFEQRHPGSTLFLIDRLKVRNIIISLPTHSIHSNLDFTKSYHRMFEKIFATRSWPVKEFGVNNEMFFIIDKGNL